MKASTEVRPVRPFDAPGGTAMVMELVITSQGDVALVPLDMWVQPASPLPPAKPSTPIGGPPSMQKAGPSVPKEAISPAYTGGNAPLSPVWRVLAAPNRVEDRSPSRKYIKGTSAIMPVGMTALIRLAGIDANLVISFPVSIGVAKTLCTVCNSPSAA